MTGPGTHVESLAVGRDLFQVPLGVADGARGLIFGLALVLLLLTLKVIVRRPPLTPASVDAPSIAGLASYAFLLVVALVDQVERFNDPNVTVRVPLTLLALGFAAVGARRYVVVAWLERKEDRAARRAAEALGLARLERERHESKRHSRRRGDRGVDPR